MRARLFFLLLAFSAAAAAQYPSRPIRLIVPIPPGGAPDIAARVLGQKLSEQMGEPVVVENRAGSNGNIATELVARAAPDGYTLGLVADSQSAINPHLYSKMSFDTLRDLTPMWAGSSNAAQIKAGRLRALAVSGGKRSAQYPELPTIGEFYPGFENSIWLGVFAPAGLPEAVLERLRAEIRRALESGDVKQRL